MFFIWKKLIIFKDSFEFCSVFGPFISFYFTEYGCLLYLWITCNLCRIEGRSIWILECNLWTNGLKDDELFGTGLKLFFNVPYIVRSFSRLLCFVRSFGLSLFHLKLTSLTCKIYWVILRFPIFFLSFVLRSLFFVIVFISYGNCSLVVWFFLLLVTRTFFWPCTINSYLLLIFSTFYKYYHYDLPLLCFFYFINFITTNY